MQNYLTSTLKNLQHTVFLDTPKWLFHFWTKPIGARKKRENQRGIFGALQTNVVKFVQKDIKSFKNHNFLCAQKILENQ
jgi:hypothetical protein